MITNLAHTIRLYPNKTQEVFFKKACGCARVAYNYGLNKYKEQLNLGLKPKIIEIKKQFNREKETLYPWMSETNKDANQQPFTNLQTAFVKFFKKQGNFPKFKKKGVKNSFYISNDRFGVDRNRFRIPKLGWVKGAESLRLSGKINSATIKRKANYWFVVVSVEIEIHPKTCDNQTVIGVDMGIKTLATLSNGVKIESGYPLKKKIDKLRLLQRRLSRKVRGSSNRQKQIMRVAKLYYEISCIRRDGLNKLTTYLCQNFKSICIEDLNVLGMLKNRKLALAISDMGFGELRRQLIYKSKLYENKIVLVDRFFPSSKTCYRCNWIKNDLILSDREFVCKNCGLVIDRDQNAAINIKNFGLNKLRETIPEVTPVDKKALILRNQNETFLEESGILTCTEMYM
jgi:putative transposase